MDPAAPPPVDYDALFAEADAAPVDEASLTAAANRLLVASTLLARNGRLSEAFAMARVARMQVMTLAALRRVSAPAPPQGRRSTPGGGLSREPLWPPGPGRYGDGPANPFYPDPDNPDRPYFRGDDRLRPPAVAAPTEAAPAPAPPEPRRIDPRWAAAFKRLRASKEMVAAVVAHYDLHGPPC